MPFKHYLAELRQNLASGVATEPTHYPALKRLLEELDPGVRVFPNPKHGPHGAPDFTLKRKGHVHDFLAGWVEAKDLDEDLDKVEKSDQLKRYLRHPNLLLTDFLQFRWYVNGQKRLTARLATRKGKKLSPEPEGETQVHALLLGFLQQPFSPAATPKQLALQMAQLAHYIRDAILKAFETEAETGKLHKQLEAFRETLIPDLKPDQFADMYAQTIAYGLFAARCQPAPADEKFSREKAAYLIPKTNPFLRKLFNEIAGPELDPRIADFVDDLVTLLRDTDIGAVLADFGKRTGREDPVVHFYEDFLQAYDPKERKIRGIYYTPEPVVSYIVRSIDHLVKTRFDKPLGLADPSVLILDPACGTGTFLYFVIRQIYETLREQGQLGAWNDYVSRNLLPRIFGFELLMAPYAVAHLKLGLQLKDLGYQFDTDERLGIYLTNTLEEAIKKSEKLFAEWIADEANAASEIKRDKPIMVVLGNPPYSGISANRGKWITKLIEDYRKVDGKPLGEKKVWLQNDYVKFLRFAQWRIQRTGQGVVGLITDHSYLDSPTFRGMRQNLLDTFTEIYILDLHGDAKRKEVSPDGSKDENVFDIMQGVAITLLIRKEKETRTDPVLHADLWGVREQKYKVLAEGDIAATPWQRLKPAKPFYLFEAAKGSYLQEYNQGWKVTEVFPTNSVGFMSARDHFVVDMSQKTLSERLQAFYAPRLHTSEIKTRFAIKDYRRFRIDEIREKRKFDPEKIKRCLYRPFDSRYVYYDQYIVQEWQRSVLQHALYPNIALVVGRAGQVAGSGQWNLVFAARSIVDLNVFYRGGGQFFPAYTYSAEERQNALHTKSRLPNIARAFIDALTSRLGLNFVEDGRGDLKVSVGPEDVTAYTYAVLHSPSYRKRYAEFLKIDFPRVPLTSDKKLFAALVEKGAELVSLHLLESPRLNKFITRYEQPGNHLVEKVRYEEVRVGAGLAPAREKQMPRPARHDKHEVTGRVYINKTQYFEGVPKDVWEFHIGGYQVSEKWLKDRKGRTLSFDDIQHYQKIVVALNETIRLMAEIDALIPSWPLP